MTGPDLRGDDEEARHDAYLRAQYRLVDVRCAICGKKCSGGVVQTPKGPMVEVGRSTMTAETAHQFKPQFGRRVPDTNNPDAFFLNPSAQYLFKCPRDGLGPVSGRQFEVAIARARRFGRCEVVTIHRQSTSLT